MSETQQFLVPQDQYLKAGIHIGTKFRTKYMEPFIYKTTDEGGRPCYEVEPPLPDEFVR